MLAHLIKSILQISDWLEFFSSIKTWILENIFNICFIIKQTTIGPQLKLRISLTNWWGKISQLIPEFWKIYVSYIFIIKTTHLTSFLLHWVILIWLLSVVIFCLLCSVTTIGPQLIALQFSYNLKLNWKRCEEQNSNTKHWPAKWTNKRNKHEQINIKSLFELMCEKINWWKHNPKLRQKITKYF